MKNSKQSSKTQGESQNSSQTKTDENNQSGQSEITEQKWGEYIMIRQKVTITNPTGLHLRPAGMFCNIASRYKCKVEFMYNDDTAANAKSVLSVLGACVKSGDEIELICDGEDEEEAMKAMVEAVESGLGE